LAEAGVGIHADIAARLVQLQEGAPSIAVGTGPPNLNALSDTVNDSRALRSAVADLLTQPSLP
jgi:hypothetical protein